MLTTPTTLTEPTTLIFYLQNDCRCMDHQAVTTY